MSRLRGGVAILLCVSLYCAQSSAAGGAPVGVLTRAQAAFLKGSAAFIGLSVFEGEILSTQPEGKLGVRLGMASLSLDGASRASVQRIDGGAHVDLLAGALFFNAPDSGLVEVHVSGATLRPRKKQFTQASVRILGPTVLQVAAIHGDLAFSYRQEFQIIPEGETYRIYLDSPSDAQNPAGSGAPGMSSNTKLAIYIVAGAAAAGLTAWGIHSAVESGGSPESPAKP